MLVLEFGFGPIKDEDDCSGLKRRRPETSWHPGAPGPGSNCIRSYRPFVGRPRPLHLSAPGTLRRRQFGSIGVIDETSERKPTDRTYWLIVAWQPESNEYKYCISNAPPNTSLITLMRMIFTRWHVEHSFRAAKGEIGFMDYEGRRYDGLMRHLTLCKLVMLVIAEQTADKVACSP